MVQKGGGRGVWSRWWSFWFCWGSGTSGWAVKGSHLCSPTTPLDWISNDEARSDKTTAVYSTDITNNKITTKKNTDMMTFLQPKKYSVQSTVKTIVALHPALLKTSLHTALKHLKGVNSNCTIAGQASGAWALIWQNTHQSKVLSNKTHVKAHLKFKWPIILIMILNVLNLQHGSICYNSVAGRQT